MAIRIVQSKQNPRLKELRAALLRPGRGETDVVALEGLHLVDEALRSGTLIIQTVFVALGHEHLLETLGIAIDETAIQKSSLSRAKSSKLRRLHRKPAAHRRSRPPTKLAMVGGAGAEARHARLIVVLSGIQDPGNLGTILRSAEAFGATGVVCLTGTVSRWNPKAMRASAGSVFRLPVLTASEAKAFQHLREAGIAPRRHGPRRRATQRSRPHRPVALVIGSEGSGLSPEIAAQCDAASPFPAPAPSKASTPPSPPASCSTKPPASAPFCI
jgi:TrmH family RNA methyltransferase